MLDIGSRELLVILGVALLLFGAKRIPEAAKALGQSLNAFKAGLRDMSSDAAETENEAKKLPEQTKA